MSQTTCQLIGANAITDSNLASSIYATTNQVKGVTTTGSINTGTATLTVVSGAGISNGDSVVGQGIAPGTTVLSGGGTTSLTLSANAGITLISDSVSFFTSIDLLTPGNTAGKLCRSWVNFNGTTGQARAAYNVSAVTRNGVGDYTINFTTAMPDGNYCACVNSGNAAGGSTGGWTTAYSVGTSTASSLRVSGYSIAGAFQDQDQVMVAIFR